MKSFTYRIEDPNGMHARPAGTLAAQAKKFNSEVTVRVGEKKADGKRLLSLMSLGATHGTELIFDICGNDEEKAAATLLELCARGAFGAPSQKGNRHDSNKE